jgi:hypothetical protein
VALAESALRIAGVAAGAYLVIEHVMQMIPLMMAGGPLPASFNPANLRRSFSDIELAAMGMGVPVPVAASVVFALGISCIGLLGHAAWKQQAAA